MIDDDFDKWVRQQAKTATHHRLMSFQTVILEKANTGEPFYIDDLDFDHLLCGKQTGETYNVIGAAVKDLVRLGAIHQTGNFRKSTSKAARGRVIFEYLVGGQNEKAKAIQ